MEAHKFYDLKQLLIEFNEYLHTNQKVLDTLNVLEKEIDNYEFERIEKIRADSEDYGTFE